MKYNRKLAMLDMMVLVFLWKQDYHSSIQPLPLAKQKDERDTILTMLDYQFDILGITETNIINDDIPPTFNMTMKG